ncbi:MAG: efflux RND transporter periplasmic adaptor subunit [Proteobacteria bacterium]|nr:efflux RND transporter periplasmic adaptor subunit [Pseudomonadota bacterium]
MATFRASASATLALLAGLSLAACQQESQAPAAAKSAGLRVVPVTVGEAVARRIEVRLEQVGSLEANRAVTVRSEASGTIVELAFAEGQPVREGAVLVRLDDRKLQAEIAMLEAGIQQLEARLANRRRDLERNPPLVEAEIRKLDEQLRQLRFRLANRERELERNRPLLEKDLVAHQAFDRNQTEADEIRAEIARTEVELARQRDLVAKQSADSIRTDIAEIEAQIAKARASLTQERVRLADATIRAPFDAVAGVRNVNVGDYLAAGGAVVTVVDLDPLEISFRVPEKHRSRVTAGQPVTLRVDAAPGESFLGAVSFIAPQVDTETRTFQVKAAVRNPGGHLSPGMFARAELVTEVHEDALTVPWESVVQTEAGAYLYAVDGDVARQVPLQLGETTSEWAEVLGTDLQPGARVVLEGKFALRDGVPVTVKEPQPAAPPPSANR